MAPDWGASKVHTMFLTSGLTLSLPIEPVTLGVPCQGQRHDHVCVGLSPVHNIGGRFALAGQLGSRATC